MPKLSMKEAATITGNESGPIAAMSQVVARGKSASDRLPASPAEVKATRKGMNVSQARFADLVGVSSHSVTAWERGVRRPDGVASRLIRLLGQKPDFIQTWQDL
jgi:putative transcriptional regulator